MFEKLENQATERVIARYFYFLRIDDGEQCGTQNNVRATLQSAFYGDTDCGCQRQATPWLEVGFPTEKSFDTLRFGCSGFVFAVIGFCHRLTATSRLPESRSG